MTLALPPSSRPAGTPVISTLPAGAVLQRVHSEDYDAHIFNPTARSIVDEGGRFDAVRAGSYAYTYAGQDDHAAIAETLCRDLPEGGGARIVPAVMLRARLITQVRTTRDLQLLQLHYPACTHVGAGLALTKCEAREYLTTRAWAEALLGWLPNIDGFSYLCRHDERREAYVFFDQSPGHPRAHEALETVAGTSLSLTSPEGVALVRRVLNEHNATLAGIA